MNNIIGIGNIENDYHQAYLFFFSTQYYSYSKYDFV